ncbi:MAG: hypothetical protein ABIM60_00010 [candidate division WOR-3 bacterium]
MKKYWVIFLIIGISCIKVPKEQPKWWITLRCPIGDSCVTVYDILKDQPDKYEIIYDSPEIDSVFSIQRHTETNVYVDTTTFQVFYASLRRSLGRDIDTMRSLFRSLLFTMVGKVKIKGYAPDTIKGYVRFTPWCWDTIGDTMKIWSDDTIYFKFSPGNIDTIIRIIYPNFPFGPHKLQIRVEDTKIKTGSTNLDTIWGMKRVLFAAQLLGDIVFTKEDTFEVEKEIRKAAKKGQIAKIRIVLNFRHSIPGEAYGTIYLKGLEWPPDSVIHNFPFYAAPKDTVTGKSINAKAWSDTLELTKDDFNVFQDSLVFYSIKILIPKQGKAYLRSRDSLRVNGWVEATVLTDLETLEEK